jgi:hypothetical protein
LPDEKAILTAPSASKKMGWDKASSVEGGRGKRKKEKDRRRIS